MTAIKGVRVTPRAIVDLDDIWFSIAIDSPTTADGFIDRLTERFVLLSEHPLVGRAREDLGSNLRSIAYRGYVIIYIANMSGVDVVRVVHGARKIDEALSDD